MNNINRYNHFFNRVWYSNGFRDEVISLPDWMHVTITTDTDRNNKFLTVYSQIHVEKEAILYPVYSEEYTDIEILKELSDEIRRLYL